MRRRLVACGLAMGFGASAACAPSGFQSSTVVDSVRILASSADQPYAKPGATVNVQVLAVDGRAEKTTPMTVYWLPVVCVNPLNDAYYNCFPQFAGGLGKAAAATTADAGAAGGSIAGDGSAEAGISIQPGVDLTRYLPTGPSFAVQIPMDAVATHVTQPPATPYGLVIVFNVACAGRLELLPPNPSNVQAAPVGCFDADGNLLGPDDYVFGFSRIYVYDELENSNPVIDHVDVNGQAVDLQLGFQVSHCAANSCASVHIGPVVPASSQEADPVNNSKEEIWADFYSTFGSFSDEARLLYGPSTGSLGAPSATDDQFQPPNTAGAGTIWIVVHDNRGGASWVTVPVQAN